MLEGIDPFRELPQTLRKFKQMVYRIVEGENMDDRKIKIKRTTGIREAKELENATADSENLAAMMDYIAACDYPEILEDEGAAYEDNL